MKTGRSKCWEREKRIDRRRDGLLAIKQPIAAGGRRREE